LKWESDFFAAAEPVQPEGKNKNRMPTCVRHRFGHNKGRHCGFFLLIRGVLVITNTPLIIIFLTLYYNFYQVFVVRINFYYNSA